MPCWRRSTSSATGGGGDIPIVDVPGTRPPPDPVPGTGGGGGGDGGGDGGGGGGGGGGDGTPPVQVVVIHGTPDPEPMPVVNISIPYDPSVPLLPPRDRLYDLAALDNKCVYGPWVVCVVGKRPPPLESDRLPSGRMPLFPQSLCNFSHLLCTAGQEQRDNERIPGSETSGKTKAELDDICVRQNIVDIDVCKANFLGWRTTQVREFLTCQEKANSRMYACFRTADRLTDYGQHPAP